MWFIPFLSNLQKKAWWLESEENYLVVSNISYFHPYLGKISNLTNIFQMGWNHQPEKYCIRLHTGISLLSCNLNGVPGVSMTHILVLVDQGESSWWFVQAFRRRCAGLWGKVLYEPFMGTPSEGTKMGSIRVRVYESWGEQKRRWSLHAKIDECKSVSMNWMCVMSIPLCPSWPIVF